MRGEAEGASVAAVAARRPRHKWPRPLIRVR